MKDSCVKFLETEDGFFISTYSSNFTTWTSFPLPFFAWGGNMEGPGDEFAHIHSA